MIREIQRGLVLSCALLGACGVTDTGNPPLDIDIGAIDFETSSTSGGARVVSGRAGAIWPGQGSVRIVNLERLGQEANASVASDGSFSSDVEVGDGEVVRLVAVDGSVRSQPVDLTGTGARSVAMPECLRSDAGFSAAAGVSETTFDVVLSNECDQPVRFGEYAMRDPAGDLTLLEASFVDGPGDEIAPGESRTLAIVVSATAGTEGVFFARILEPQVARRAFTLAVSEP